MHSEWPKLNGVLAIQSATGLIKIWSIYWVWNFQVYDWTYYLWDQHIPLQQMAPVGLQQTDWQMLSDWGNILSGPRYMLPSSAAPQGTWSERKTMACDEKIFPSHVCLARTHNSLYILTVCPQSLKKHWIAALFQNVHWNIWLVCVDLQADQTLTGAKVHFLTSI